MILASIAIATGCGGDDTDKSSGDAPKGLTTLIDGSTDCADRQRGGPLPAGAPSAAVDELSFAIDPADKPKAGSGKLDGYWIWPAPAQLTAERNVVVVVEPGQTDSAALRYDPRHEDVGFEALAQTLRFASCRSSELSNSGEKTGKFTRFQGDIVTRDKSMCLKLRLVSERNRAAKFLILPLGRDCA